MVLASYCGTAKVVGHISNAKMPPGESSKKGTQVTLRRSSRYAAESKYKQVEQPNTFVQHPLVSTPIARRWY